MSDDLDPADRALDPVDRAQIDQLMAALVSIRDIERQVAGVAMSYMKLGPQEMRALRAIMLATADGEVVTPGWVGALLEISPASTTKLLNKLEKDGHIRRLVHPTDRRAFSLVVTEDTQEAANKSVGGQVTKRMRAAARLSRAERTVVIDFLHDLADELRLGRGDTWAETVTPAQPDSASTRR